MGLIDEKLMRVWPALILSRRLARYLSCHTDMMASVDNLMFHTEMMAFADICEYFC